MDALVLAPRPRWAPGRDAAYMHGRDLVGDTGYEPAARTAEDEHAALGDPAPRMCMPGAGVIALPADQPALALRLDPSLPQRVARCIVMGAAVTAHGNITPPRNSTSPSTRRPRTSCSAASRRSSWRTGRRCWRMATRTRTSSALAADSPRAFTRASPRIPAPGPGPAAASAGMRPMRWRWRWPCSPRACSKPSRPLAVEIAASNTRGATIVDWNRQGGAPDNVDILMQYDQTRFGRHAGSGLAAG